MENLTDREPPPEADGAVPASGGRNDTIHFTQSKQHYPKRAASIFTGLMNGPISQLIVDFFYIFLKNRRPTSKSLFSRSG